MSKKVLQDVTVATALALIQGTIDLSGWSHDLKLGGSLDIGTNDRWIKYGRNLNFMQFYIDACTMSDISTGGPQDLGSVKVDD